MSAAAAPQSILETIRERLKAGGIAEVAIVDDTYDGISNDTLQPGMAVFVDALSDAGNLVQLTAVCPKVVDADQFDLDSARDLWSKQPLWSPQLKALADPLFHGYRQRSDHLKGISTGLSKLGLTVHERGVKDEIPQTVQLVFLDYHLEPENAAGAAQRQAADLAEKGARADPVPSLAEKIAAELAKRGANRPFLVLISEWTELAQVQAEFRKRTRYLGGTFAFLAKHDAAQEQSLFFYLGCWGVGHPALPIIRDFFSTMAESLERVAEDFHEALLELDVHDYSFIQRLSLTPDGEPLGEYVLHLLAESLGHRVRNFPAVRDARAQLDRVSFKTHLPSTTQPSSAVARLYREAFTDRGEEPLDPHPLQHLQHPRPEVAVPRVSQGDLFVTPDRTHIYLIINPGCDLQFSPLNPKRLPDPKVLLYLMEGLLTPFSQAPEGKTEMRTEPYEIDGVPFRIIWHHAVVIPVPLGDLVEWCKETGCKRIARLREINAASLQQAWVANLGRIGLPVAPPYFSQADFKMYVKAKDLLLPVGGRVVGGVVLTQHWQGSKLVHSFTLTQEAVTALVPGFKAAAEHFVKAAEAVPAGEHRDAKAAALTASAANAVKAAHLDLPDLFLLMEGEHKLGHASGEVWSPQGGAPIPITCFWDGKLEGKKWGDLKIPQNSLLVVDILPPEIPVAAAPAEVSVAPNAEPETEQAARCRLLQTLAAHAKRPPG